MTYTQEITLDLNSNMAYPVVSAKQQDVDSRVILVHLTKDGSQYQVNSNNSVALRVRKPDMHMCFIDGTINSDGTVSVTLSQQCLTTAGRAYADLVEFNAAGQMLSTVSFIISIMASPDVMGAEAISSDDFQYLKNTIDSWDRTVAEAQEWANGYNGDTPLGTSSSISAPGSNNNAKYYSETAKYWSDNAESLIEAASSSAIYEAEAWAKGTKNGSPVPSSDPTYHNNSKYFVQDAEAWARGTRDSVAVANSDPTYHNNSKYFVQDAEAWAKGTRNGDEVISSDTTYHNNSKYWASRSKNVIESMTFSYNILTGVLSVTIEDP